jgi:diketogulonate reductase-like aldo/keto reductase
MVNVPFGGRRGASENFARLAATPLPDFAAEFDCKTWPQFFIKYLASHPAVTVVVAGTRRVEHIEDNMGGAHGRLPDAAMRKRMERFYDTPPACSGECRPGVSARTDLRSAVGKVHTRPGTVRLIGRHAPGGRC